MFLKKKMIQTLVGVEHLFLLLVY